MAGNKSISILHDDERRVGAEIVYGAEECYKHSVDLLAELGFPKGVLPLQDLVECGRVRETGFVWMKQKAPYEHFFAGSNSRVSYATEVTSYVEKNKMKKMTGVKSKQLLLWVPIVEMTVITSSNNYTSTNQDDNGDDDVDDGAPAVAATAQKIYFKTPMGIGKSFPITAFMTEEEKNKYLNAAA